MITFVYHYNLQNYIRFEFNTFFRTLDVLKHQALI